MHCTGLGGERSPNRFSDRLERSGHALLAIEHEQIRRLGLAVHIVLRAECLLVKAPTNLLEQRCVRLDVRRPDDVIEVAGRVLCTSRRRKWATYCPY